MCRGANYRKGKSPGDCQEILLSLAVPTGFAPRFIPWYGLGIIKNFIETWTLVFYWLLQALKLFEACK